MNIYKLLDRGYVLSKEELKELQDYCYSNGCSFFPVNMFFNDIRDNKEKNFDKNQAYKDLWAIILTTEDDRKAAEKVHSYQALVDLIRSNFSLKTESREFSKKMQDGFVSFHQVLEFKVEAMSDKLNCDFRRLVLEKACPQEVNAFRLIVNKGVDMALFLDSKNAEDYNFAITTYVDCRELSQEEFDTIKRGIDAYERTNSI